MTAAADLPSRTYECCTCEVTYFAGAHAGAGPFYCEFCLLELTLRPEGAEPYAGGAVEAAAYVPLEVRRRVCGRCPAVAQLEMRL